MHIMKRIFSKLEEKEIAYAHFKSNVNLDESFAGYGDFDVLVDNRKLNEVEDILRYYGGKRHNPTYYGIYPGVDNWLIFEYETGLIYHLHLHFQLATGKALVKDYVIPWSNIIFESRIRDKKYNIYITEPNLELILLMVRSVVKAHLSDYIKVCFGLYSLHESLEQERQLLMRDVDQKKLTLYIEHLFGRENLETLLKYATKDKIRSGDFYRLSKIIRWNFKYNRRMSALTAGKRAVTYRMGDLWNKFISRKLGIVTMTKKSALSGGLIIAFVGVDGAGKSTITNEIYKWISRKIDCTRFYMGSGDGTTTVYVSVIKRLKKLIIGDGPHIEKTNDVILGDMTNAVEIPSEKRPFYKLRQFVVMTMIASVEKKNYRKMIRIQRYKMNGGISILDRFPQIEQPDMNDGPKIEGFQKILGRNLYTEYLRKKEIKLFEPCKSIKPDIVFRICVSPKTALMRKGELVNHTNIEFNNDKAERLFKVTYQNAPIIDIDSEQPYEDEVLQIKRILWEYI